MSNLTLPHCPECGQSSLIHIGTQTYPAKYNLPDRVEVECTNPACKLHASTNTLATIAKQNAAANNDEVQS